MGDRQFGFREIVPDQTLPEKWKELSLNTGGTQSTLQDIKVAERAGGYCYKDSSKHHTRNRFIYWRICHDVLELVEQSLDLNLTGNHLKFKFQDTPILEGLTIQEMYSNSVVILVATVSSVYRLVFPHPDKIHSQDVLKRKSEKSIFADANLNSARQQYVINNTAPNATLPHTSATWLGFNEDALFALSYSTGTVLLIKMDNLSGMVSSWELKQVSLMDRLWSGFVPVPLMRSKPIDTAVPSSMVLHSIGMDTYLFTISRDCRLRMWSCARHECILVADVLENTAEAGISLEQGPQNHLVRKAIGKDENDLYLGVFLSFSNNCMFVVLKPKLDQGIHHLERVYTSYAPQCDLVDFFLSPTKLWALWSTCNGETQIKHKSMEKGGRSEWQSVLLEQLSNLSLEISEENNEDPRQAYLSHIFQPGLFPLSVINRALSIFRRPAGVMPTFLPEVSASVLRERVAVAVDAGVREDCHDCDLLDDMYLESSWRGWRKFYSCCLQYHWAGTRPIGFLAGPPSSSSPGPLPGCPLGIVRKSQFSLFRPIDELEQLYTLGTECSPAPTLTLSCSDVPGLGHAIVRLLAAAAAIENKLSDDIKKEFDRDIYHTLSPDVITDRLVTSIMNDSDTPFNYEFLTSLWCNIDERCIVQSAHEVFNLMIKVDSGGDIQSNLIHNNQEVSPQQLLSVSYMFSSELGSNFVAETMHQIASNRSSILRNLLFLWKLTLKCYHQVFPASSQSQRTVENISSILIPTTNLLVLGYHTLNWIAHTPCTPVASNMLDASVQQLSVLSMSDGPRDNECARITQRSQRSLTLLSLFLMSGGARLAHECLAQNNLDEDEMSQWNSSLLPYSLLVSKLVWPMSRHFVFPEFLLSSCQYLLVQEYVRLLSSWTMAHSFSRKFLLGSVLLDMGEAEKACDHMIQAAEGVLSEEFLSVRLGQPLPGQPEGSAAHRLVLYYLKVIKMFEQKDHSDCVLRLASEAIVKAEPDDPDLPTLHSTRFSHLLRLGRHNEAYDSMVNNPDTARRKDTLRQLINSMVEQRKVRQLVQFSFDEMHEDVDKIMEDKARSQDLLTSQFYNILYSFHVVKGNYRRAATVKYEQALRLAQEVVGVQGLQCQANCLLACINSLSLVSKNYTWMVVPRLSPSTLLVDEDDITPPGMSPKRRSDGEKVFHTSLKRKVELVELEDIRKEYEVVLAKLKLVGHSPTNSAVSVVSHLTAGQMLPVLASNCMFDTALRLASLFSLPKDDVVETLAARCVRLTREEGNGSTEAWEWLKQNNIDVLSRGDNSASSVAWKLLQHCIATHEEKGSTKLHRAVVQRFIQMEAFLPHWLAVSYKRINAGELLRLLLPSGRLEEAGELACEMYRAGLGEGPEIFGMRHGLDAHREAIFLPHKVLELALLELKSAAEEGDGPQYIRLFDEIKELRSKYLSTAARASQNIITASVPLRHYHLPLNSVGSE